MGEPRGAVKERRRWQGEATDRCQSASGALVSINAPGHDMSQPWTGEFRLQVEPPYDLGPAGTRNRAFQVGPVGTLANHTHHVVKGTFVEELSLGGGYFLVARSDVDGRGLAGWQGRWHEVYIFRNNPDWSTRDALRLFLGLTFHDSPLGVTVIPSGLPPETLYGEQVHKHIPGVGVLLIMPGATGAGLLPAWSGARTRAGHEVWRKHVSDDGTGRTVLLHASRSAVTAVYAEPGEKEIEEPRLRFLDDVVDVTWSP